MRNWKLLKQNEHNVSALCKALHCPHFFARILLNRGVSTAAEAKAFLKTSADALYDPYLFRNMKAVVERIVTAIRRGEKITVYGDYDVDGITATSLLLKVLREFGGKADFYIPSRFTDGYGVNSAVVERIAAEGTTLMITVDTGITAVKEVEEAKRLGMDVIITDHHECQSVLPDTLILNPKCPDSGYPFGELAGVGVVYKLACALNALLGHGDGIERYAPLAAIGTVADIMPMREENRFIVRKGLELMKELDCPGLQVLLERCVGDRPVDTSTVGFIIAPRINAAGRMGSAQLGVELLTTRDKKVAERLVDELCKENQQRQSTENEILNRAIEMIEGDPSLRRRNAIVLWSEDWHNGVIGIVASRLKERYGKPCILFTVNGEFAKGSGRSVRPFNLFEALEQLSGGLEKFGGHAFAAGVLVRTEQLEQFRDAFCQKVDAFLAENQFDECIEMDCLLNEADLNVHKIRELDKLAPFGRGNETPIFGFMNAELLEAISTANGNHMRLSMRCGNLRVTAFYFNVTAFDFCYQAGETVDVVFEADINEYNGRSSVRLLVKDIRYGSVKAEPLMNLLRRFEQMEVSLADVPSRNDIAAVYRYFKKQEDLEKQHFDLFTLQERIAREQQARLTFGAIYFSLSSLRELGVLSYRLSDSLLTEMQIHPENRVNLEDSVILKKLKEKAGEIG